ncbi:DNA-binding transcriptional regulator, MarR family [Frankineae bacterium MT45]|nr:DNA-binding transcriptional regulator, MarR family [Frankineae bacterium MT45]
MESPQTTEIDPALVSAAAALRELILASENYRQVVATKLALTVSETQAVSYLYARGRMGQGDLGAAMGFNTSSTTALVDRLERNSLAERVADPSDRRRSIIQLTAGGQQVVNASREWFIHAFDEIPAGELGDVAEVLLVLAEGLRARTSTIPAEPEMVERTAPRRRR